MEDDSKSEGESLSGRLEPSRKSQQTTSSNLTLTSLNSIEPMMMPQQTNPTNTATTTHSAPHQQQQHKRIFKIIVIGDSNVGKTCLTFRFCGGKFLQRSEATIGVDFRERAVQIDDEVVKLQIWDTAGQERFRKSMIAHYYRNVHAVLFVYDVTNVSSFENLTYWIDEFNRNCQSSHKQIPKILVGNKCDLNELVRVNTNVAQTFADMHQMPLFETSAKDDSKQDHVEAIFMTLALKLKNSKPFFVPDQLHRANVQAIQHEQLSKANSNSSNGQAKSSYSYSCC
jgi:Ras-related protein Rab-33B